MNMPDRTSMTSEENLNKGVVLQTADGKIYACNSLASEILGRSKSQILESKSSDSHWGAIRLDGTPIPDEMRPSAVALRSGMPVLGAIVGVRISAEKYVWVRVDTIPVFNDHQTTQPSAVISIFEKLGPVPPTEPLKQFPLTLQKSKLQQSTADLNSPHSELYPLMLSVAESMMKIHVHEPTFPMRGKSTLSYEVFLEIMQLSECGTKDVQLQSVIHSEHFSSRRIYDYLQWLESEGWVDLSKIITGTKTSREVYIHPKQKLIDAFREYTLLIMQVLSKNKG